MSWFADALTFSSESLGFDIATFSQRWMMTLLYFLWQGLLVGLVVVFANRLLKRGPATARYAFLLLAMLSLPVCVVATFLLTDVQHQVAAATTGNEAQTAASATSDEPASSLSGEPIAPPELHDDDRFDLPAAVPATSAAGDQTPTESWSMAEWVVLAYSIGAAFFLVRLVILVWGGQRLRRASTVIDDESLLAKVRELSTKLGLKFAPVVAWCDRVAVPTVIGLIRPTILLPATLMSGLDAKQVEAILSHEMAHIRRYDLWTNLLQRVIESLLFFHPVVWFVSRQLSNEREACCDDLVVASGHDSMDYAGALLRVAELSCSDHGVPSAMLAVSGNRTSQLEARINRLMADRHQSPIRLNRSGAITLLLLLGLTLTSPIVLAGIIGAGSSLPTAVQENDGPANAVAAAQETSNLSLADFAKAMKANWRSPRGEDFIETGEKGDTLFVPVNLTSRYAVDMTLSGSVVPKFQIGFSENVIERCCIDLWDGTLVLRNGEAFMELASIPVPELYKTKTVRLQFEIDPAANKISYTDRRAGKKRTGDIFVPEGARRGIYLRNAGSHLVIRSASIRKLAGGKDKAQPGADPKVLFDGPGKAENWKPVSNSLAGTFVNANRGWLAAMSRQAAGFHEIKEFPDQWELRIRVLKRAEKDTCQIGVGFSPQHDAAETLALVAFKGNLMVPRNRGDFSTAQPEKVRGRDYVVFRIFGKKLGETSEIFVHTSEGRKVYSTTMKTSFLDGRTKKTVHGFRLQMRGSVLRPSIISSVKLLEWDGKEPKPVPGD